MLLEEATETKTGQPKVNTEVEPIKPREELIKDWVGKVKNLDRIRSKNVYGDRWRVDVFTKIKAENALYDKRDISQSYFLKIVGNKITDLTIHEEKE